MKNKPMISVIVPVYNVEKYIKKGIESLLAQSYQNIEIILVDDGSPDNSPAILDQYTKKDSRIKVLHQKNQGVSTARNNGIKISNGEYILFVDGDDYVGKDYVEFFYKLISQKSADIAVNYDLFSALNSSHNHHEKEEVESPEQIIEDIYLGKMNVAVWNKMYKKSFLEKNNIRFNPKIWYGEGMLFNIECLSSTKKIAVGSRKVYYQVYNQNSAMRSFNMESNLCGIRSLELQKKYLDKKNKKLIRAWEYHLRCFNRSILTGIIKTNSKKKYYSQYKECIRGLRRRIFLLFQVDIPLRERMWNIIAFVSPVLAIKIAIAREKRRTLS
jgi:glycosyltransferases involved in cell wall biogenesis